MLSQCMQFDILTYRCTHEKLYCMRCDFSVPQKTPADVACSYVMHSQIVCVCVYIAVASAGHSVLLCTRQSGGHPKQPLLLSACVTYNRTFSQLRAASAQKQRNLFIILTCGTLIAKKPTLEI